jgi:probable F420-dependent oxidoreductase
MSVRVGIGWGPFGGDDLSPDRFLGLVEWIEELGYDSIWLSDSATLGGPAPLVALAAVAARTRRLKLGTNVLIAPARNPVLLAKELATVDALSEGRLLPAFGLGIDAEPEAGAIGVPRSERAARTAETIEIVRLLWGGGPVTYSGRFASLDRVTLSPAPIRPGLDIWLGGSSPAALRRTGRIADGWIGSFVSPGELADCVEGISDAAADAGREIDDDHYGTTLFAAPSLDELPPQARSLLSLRPDLAFDDHVAIGTGALRALIERFLEAGASKFVVVPIADDIRSWLEQMRVEAVEQVEQIA